MAFFLNVLILLLLVHHLFIMLSCCTQMLKINGTLLRPFLVGRDIRQGCSLSDILCAIAIEPVLAGLRCHLLGISTVCPSGTDLVTVKLSAYADDVTVVIRSDEDVKKMIASLNVSESLYLKNKLAGQMGERRSSSTSSAILLEFGRV